MTVPSVFKPLVSKFQDTVVRTKHTVAPNISGNYADGSSVSFKLPTGVIADLSTIGINLDVFVKNAGSRFPRFGESFIRSIDIKTIGGVTVATLSDYAEVASLVRAWNHSHNHVTAPFESRRGLSTANQTKKLLIENILFGVLSDKKSRLFSLEAVGLEVQINFMPMKVVFEKATPATGVVDAIEAMITGISMELDLVYFNQDTYSEQLRTALSNDGLKYSFPTYSLSTSQVFTNMIDTQMNLTTSSLDGVMCLIKPAAYFAEDKLDSAASARDGSVFQTTVPLEDNVRCDIGVNGHRQFSLTASPRTAFTGTKQLMKSLGYTGVCREFEDWSAFSTTVSAVNVFELGQSGMPSYAQPINITARITGHNGSSKVLKVVAFRTAVLQVDANNSITIME